MRKTLPLTILLAACLPLCAVSATYGALSFNNGVSDPKNLEISVGAINVEDRTKVIPDGMITIESVVGKRVMVADQKFVYRVDATMTIPAGSIYEYWYDEDTNPVSFELVSFVLNYSSTANLNYQNAECYLLGNYDSAKRLSNVNLSVSDSSISFSLCITDQYIDIDYERTSIYSLVEESGIIPARDALTFDAIFDFPMDSVSPNIGGSFISFIVEMSNSL